MKLCGCGCGSEVNNPKAKYIHGHHNRDPRIKKLKEKRSLEKYGTKTPLQSKIIKDKSEKTCLKKYGTRFASQSDIVKRKKIENCKRKYGVENPNQLQSVKDKKTKTIQKKYGVDNISKLDNIKKKKKETCLKNFGVEIPYMSKTIREKGIRTCLSRFGTEHALQNSNVLTKIRNTCLKKYGVENVSQTKRNREIFRENWIKSIEKKMGDGRKLYPRSGIQEEKCIQFLQQNLDMILERDIIIHSYFPDAYIDELNLVIEFDENWHKKKWAIEHDKKKDFDLLSYGYNICRISQESFESSKKYVLKKFQLLIFELREKTSDSKEPEVFKI